MSAIELPEQSTSVHEEENRARRDEHDEISNSDLLSLMKTYMSSKLSDAEDSMKDLARKVKKSENFLKYKGHQVQFDLNSDILDNINMAIDCIEHKRLRKAVSLLSESKKELKKRNKHIRIADKSEGGWKTVDEYVSDDVASDSEDEKRIRAAETRAVKKLKASKSSKQQSDRKRPAEAAGGPSSVAHNGGSVPDFQQPFRAAGAAGPTFAKQSRAKSGDICFNCGLYGHWAKECKNPRSSRFAATRGNSA